MLVPEPHDLRASDAEREQVAQVIRDAATAGRLDHEELEERLASAYGATSRGDLVPLVADLPAARDARLARPAAPVAPSSPERVSRLAPLLALSVLLVAIWALTGAGYFWPMWPIGAMALATLKHGCCGVAAPFEHRRAPVTPPRGP